MPDSAPPFQWGRPCKFIRLLVLASMFLKRTDFRFEDYFPLEHHLLKIRKNTILYIGSIYIHMYYVRSLEMVFETFRSSQILKKAPRSDLSLTRCYVLLYNSSLTGGTKSIMAILDHFSAVWANWAYFDMPVIQICCSHFSPTGAFVDGIWLTQVFWTLTYGAVGKDYYNISQWHFFWSTHRVQS